MCAWSQAETLGGVGEGAARQGSLHKSDGLMRGHLREEEQRGQCCGDCHVVRGRQGCRGEGAVTRPRGPRGLQRVTWQRGIGVAGVGASWSPRRTDLGISGV